MKVSRKKLFGIGAVVLLVLAIFVPISNGMKVNRETDEAIECMSGTYDLELSEMDVSLNTKIPLKIINEEKAEGYVTYNVEYTVKNNGILPYDGTMEIGVVNPEKSNCPEDPEYFLKDYYWDVNVEDLAVDDTLSGVKKLEVFSSNDNDADHEKYFADEMVEVAAIGAGGAGLDNDYSDNVQIMRAENYRYDKIEDMTSTQIKRSTPWRTEEEEFEVGATTVTMPVITKMFKENQLLTVFKSKGLDLNDIIEEEQDNIDYINSLSFEDNMSLFQQILEFFLGILEKAFDMLFDNITSYFDNHRFGWTVDATRNALSIMIVVGLLALLATSCVVEIFASQAFLFVKDWIKNLGILFAAIGTPAFGSLLMGVFAVSVLSDLITHATTLLAMTIACGGVACVLLGALKYYGNRTKMWARNYPWYDPIRIYGNVSYVYQDEVVNIECREVEDYECPPGDIIPPAKMATVPFDFTVSAEGSCLPKLCRIHATSEHEKHKNKPLKTRLITSLCFPGGEVHKEFMADSWSKARSRDVDSSPFLLTILEKLSNIVGDMPLLELILSQY